MLIYIFFGFLGGLHRALWGGYKDSPYEPYKISKSLRSVIIGTSWGIILFIIFPFIGIQSETIAPAYIFLMTIALDTITTEFYKLFIRTEPQGKYAIPSMFHAWSRQISNFQRILICMSLTLFLGGLFYILTQINTYLIPIPKITVGSLTGIYGGIIIAFLEVIETVLFQSAIRGGTLGLVGGILEATGGMWKDAPFEGLEPLKFFRSPLVGLFWGTILSFNQPNLAVLFLSILGADRMTIELYKTFVIRKKIGKFKADKPTFPEWVTKRNIFVLPYVVTWAIFLIYLFLPYHQ